MTPWDSRRCWRRRSRRLIKDDEFLLWVLFFPFRCCGLFFLGIPFFLPCVIYQYLSFLCGWSQPRKINWNPDDTTRFIHDSTHKESRYWYMTHGRKKGIPRKNKPQHRNGKKRIYNKNSSSLISLRLRRRQQRRESHCLGLLFVIFSLRRQGGWCPRHG
jgi:hypothetical protein